MLTTDVQQPHTDLAGRALERLLTPPGPVDPYPGYEVLRTHAPVYRSRFGMSFVSSYAECQKVLGGEGCAVQDATWFDANTPGWRDHPATRTLYQGMQCHNAPDHTRLRRPLGGAFGSRRMARLGEHVAELCDRYLDAIADAGSDGGTVNLVDSLAIPLPIDVVAELVGVPESEREHFGVIARHIFKMIDLVVTDEERAAAADAAGELREFWTRAVADRRRAPNGDITSDLAGALDAGQLSHEELLAVVVFVFSAGFATTGALIGNATVAMLRDDRLAARIRADSGVASAIVEERCGTTRRRRSSPASRRATWSWAGWSCRRGSS